MLFVTILSIGYGDLYPTNYFGRSIALFTATLGVFLIAVVIQVIGDFVTLNQDEKLVIVFVQK